jgi:hypothetical protein
MGPNYAFFSALSYFFFHSSKYFSQLFDNKQPPYKWTLTPKKFKRSRCRLSVSTVSKHWGIRKILDQILVPGFDYPKRGISFLFQGQLWEWSKIGHDYFLSLLLQFSDVIVCLVLFRLCSQPPLTTEHRSWLNLLRFVLCLSSDILKNTTFRKLDLFPSSGEGVRGIYYVGPLSQQSRYRTHGVRNRFSLRNFVCFRISEGRNNLKNSKPECYTPSSESFSKFLAFQVQRFVQLVFICKEYDTNGEKMTACRILVGKPEGKRPSAKHKGRKKDNTKLIWEK